MKKLTKKNEKNDGILSTDLDKLSFTHWKIWTLRVIFRKTKVIGVWIEFSLRKHWNIYIFYQNLAFIYIIAYFNYIRDAKTSYEIAELYDKNSLKTLKMHNNLKSYIEARVIFHIWGIY